MFLDSDAAVWDFDVKIEDRVAADDAHGDGRDGIHEQVAGDLPRLGERSEREGQRHVARGDGCAARPCVDLEDVAIDRDRVFAERRTIDDGPQAAADEALDFECAAALLTLGCFARRSGMGSPRQHAVFRRDPAFTFALQERRYLRLDRGRAQHACIAELSEYRAFGVASEVRREAHDA